MDDLLPEFIAETRETLDALSGEIVAWEADPTDRARLDAVFRFVHTVKGSCGFLDLPRLSRLSHAAEDVLAEVRAGTRLPDTGLVSAVLAVVDRIGEVVDAIDAGRPLDSGTDDLLIAALSGQVSAAMPANLPAMPRTPARTVRLSVDLLDRMMNGMSEMVLARNELVRRLREQDGDTRAEGALDRLSATVAEMRDTVTRTRMQTVDALFSALPRMVRDTAAQVNKAVQLQVEGADVELDREMIEVIRDPLAHIVRNAIDHGIETPAERRAMGKRETGRLSVSARQSGNRIIVEVSDDGAGIDLARLGARAVAAGLVDAAGLAAMTEGERLDLIFAPGLSSREVATEVSGRGVGMDVVRTNVEAIGGRVSLRNMPGQGLTVSAEVPLTLSILSAVIVCAGGERFAVPRQTVQEIVTLRGNAVRVDRLGDAPVLTVRGTRLPLVRLSALLGTDASGTGDIMVIVSTREGSFALGVDDVVDTEELVVKPAAPVVMATGLYAGQTLPDTGRPMLLLDGPGIAARAGICFACPAAATRAEPEAEASGTPALMFRDTDGGCRAVALAAVDRVETVAAEAARRAGGGWQLVADRRIVPLVGRRDPDGSGLVVLRLTDGASELAYTIAEPLDIVTLPAERTPVPGDPAVAGLALVAGEPVEVLDLLSMFGPSTVADGCAPLCLLGPDPTGWMDAFLRPLLETSGYRCATRAGPGETPAAVLALDGEVPAGAAAPLIRLRRERTGAPGTVWRYDRDALLSALASHAGATCR